LRVDIRTPCAVTVGQFFAAPVSESIKPGWFPQDSPSSVGALGQREESEPPMGCADFLRAKEACRDAVAHCLKLSGDFKEPESKMGVHVFEEDATWLDFGNDAADVRPEMARIFSAELLARAAEGLARIARAENVGFAAIRAPIECLNVAPNVRRSQGAVLKTRNQDAGCRDFPFHVAERANLTDSKRKAESETAVSGTEFNDVWYSHTMFASRARVL
jgi:hypothetical protein